MIELGHFGLHWLPGEIAVLMQGSGPATAIGLDVEAEFTGRGRCNHRIDLSAAGTLPDIMDDPLVRAMRPLPRRGRVPWFAHADKAILSALARMSSPIQPVVRPLWSLTSAALQRELMTSNVQPLVLTDIQPQHRRLLDPLLQQSSLVIRPIVLSGDPRVALRPEAERQETNLTHDVVGLPWEAIGARVLRNHMLRIDGEANSPD